MTETAIITICGRPNVGKSTLTNALVGEKITIVSSKPQTTRNRIMGVVTKGETQFVLLDTPGFIKPRNRLGDYMVNVVKESVTDVDCILFLVEPVPEIGPGEMSLLEKIRESSVPAILVINKIDTIEKEKLLAVIAEWTQAFPFDAVVPVSAKDGDGLDILLDEMHKYVTEGPHLFPEDSITDQPERQICAELIREKILQCIEKEVPHGTAVEISKFSERENGILDIEAIIYCEKPSHKGILIGKNGSMLRQIGAEAREEMEDLLGAKVFLQTWVKVKENWRDSEIQLRNFGYRNE
ncbi:MAG: GTPase Era [Oscillospiraceae bacterium]|nr:GTPase Era [Oscillospiraceae bacterium]